MNSFARIAAAALIGIGFGTAAVAQEQAGARITGSGVDTTLTPNPDGPVFGGVLVRVTGSGESAQIEPLSTAQGQAGRIGRLVGSGESQQILYPEAAMPVRVAQRDVRR